MDAAAAAADFSFFSKRATVAPAERNMTELEARQVAADFRSKFRNSEAFEAAWATVFSLKTTISQTLARRILSEELQKFRARNAGMDVADFQPPAAVATPYPPEGQYTCPGCQRVLKQWDRHGHASSCEHAGCYQLEVNMRVAVARREAQRTERKSREQDAMLDIERD